MYCSAYFKGVLIKNKGGVGLFQFYERRNFFNSFDDQALLGVISECDPPSCTLQKRLSYHLQFGQKENIPGHSIESRSY